MITPAPAAPAKQSQVNPQQPHQMGPRQPFRQKFGQRWPNQPPRWNLMPQNHQQQMPFQRGPNPMRPMMQPGPQRNMRPGFPPQSRPPFFNNNFMQSRPLRPPPMGHQRFFYPNQPLGDPSMGPRPPAYLPGPGLVGGANSGSHMPRKVLINPNFKGGVEAAKSKKSKDLR